MKYSKAKPFNPDALLSVLTMRVLSCFFDPKREEMCGAWIFEEIEILSSTLYPILQRLDDDGWLVSRWEQAPVPRQKRRYYRMTARGRRAFERVIGDLHARVFR